jgi:hypothetical protein
MNTERTAAASAVLLLGKNNFSRAETSRLPMMHSIILVIVLPIAIPNCVSDNAKGSEVLRYECGEHARACAMHGGFL